MPWKILSALGQRLRFINAALNPRVSFSALCRSFGISRACGHKWKRRFLKDGRAGLRPRSRRPRRSPNRTSLRWRLAIQRLRRRYPRWGAKKIRARLHRKFPRARLPAVRTITKWLPRLCRLPRRPRRSRRGPFLLLSPLTLPSSPNQVWTVDFKGCFRTADGSRCDPLTVRDLFSRFLLAIRVLANQQFPQARRVFLGLFRRCGLPKIIRVDNGSPFGSTGAQGLSRLSVWWRTLGLQVEFIRPGHPEENGAHEQMHRELKRDTARPPAAHPQAQQWRSQRWLHHYNTARPHEALGDRYPADLYRPSRRPYRQPQPITYPRRWFVRKVRHNGQIKWRGRLRSIGEAFVGQPVALHQTSPGIWEVHFQDLLLGTLHDRDAGGLRPVKRSRSSP